MYFRASTDWDPVQVWHFTIWRSLGLGTRLWPSGSPDLEVLREGWAGVKCEVDCWHLY